MATSQTAAFSVSGRIDARPPFDFAQSLAFVREFMPTADEQLVTERSLTKAIDIHGQIVTFTVTATSDANDSSITYALRSAAAIDDIVHVEARRRISDYLSLDDDLRQFYALAEADAAFQPLIRQLHGFHQVRFLTLSECACWCVLSQHIAMPVARRMRRALADRFGGQIDVDDHTFVAFPSFESLERASAEDLADAIGNHRRAAVLRGVLDALAAIDEGWLRTVSYDDADARLRQISGIGPWSAAAILLRGLGRPERLILEMRPLLAAFERRYGPQARIADVASRYGETAGFWGLYLSAAG